MNWCVVKMGRKFLFALDFFLLALNVCMYVFMGQHWWNLVAAGAMLGAILALLASA